MINSEIRELFKENLGHNFNYSPAVAKVLARKNITNRNGKPHSLSMIRNVFQGQQSNIDIETAILEVYDVEFQKIKERNLLLNKLKGKG